jgi:hypothetical protein
MFMDRRAFLRSTTFGALGLTLPRFLQLEAAAQSPGRPTRRAKSMIFLCLYGGPSQIDIWDMKPDAPEEYRGEFRPMQTSVPGTHIVEHLPRMARLAQHYSIIRTLYHTNRNHQPAGCYLFTGVYPGSDNAGVLAPRPDDPPAIGSIAVKMSPVRNAGIPPFIMMPARLNDQGSAFKGQTGGWLGSAFDPLLINQDPSSTTFRLDAFEQQEGVPLERLGHRRSLLQELDQSALAREASTGSMNQFQQRAFDLITSRQGQSAFDLTREPAAVRDRYGRNRFGQGCLLARRLIEAGARVVTVSDCTASGHHEWDTHNGNFSKLRRELLPRLDRAYSALLEDLMTRGMLDDTVVYLGGEFGRTPRIGQGGFSGAGASRDGRDHYPNCFCGILAGGRTRAGIVHGTSDSKAAYPSRDPVSLPDLTATLLAAMGLDPYQHVTTRENRPVPVTHGRIVNGLLR